MLIGGILAIADVFTLHLSAATFVRAQERTLLTIISGIAYDGCGSQRRTAYRIERRVQLQLCNLDSKTIQLLLLTNHFDVTCRRSFSGISVGKRGVAGADTATARRLGKGNVSALVLSHHAFV